MRLKMITNNNLRDVEDMLPDVFTQKEDLLGVACIDEKGAEDTVLGVSVVFPNEEEDVLEIQWMYVQPEHRRKGAGSCMLNGIRDMAKAAGLRLIDVCFWGEETREEKTDTWTIDPSTENDDRWDGAGDIAENEYTGTGILKHFLQERGFLTRSEYPIYSFLLSDIIASDYVRTHQKNKNSEGMKAYEEISWGELSESMKESVKKNVIQAGFTDLTGLSSPDISFVCVKDGKIAGCLLSADSPAEKTITVMLLISFIQDPVCSAKLIAVAGDRILSRYPEDYRISFIALNENTLKLLRTILDDRNRLLLDGYTVRGILEA